MIPALLAHLTAAGARELAVLDVGAGTGGNQRWLRPHLPLPQHWVHLDQDPTVSRHDPGGPGTVLVTGDVGSAGEIVQSLPSGRRILTCAALLDVLTAEQIRTLCAAAAAARAPALFSLTVTGAWDLDPGDRLDTRLRESFDDHQRRAGRAGPDAADLAVQACQTGGARILTADTPWHLDAGSGPELVDRFLRERVAAAVEQSPNLTGPATVWLARRRAELASRRLRIGVGHRDVLALPAG